MESDPILDDLRRSLDHLAAAVADAPETALALRRFAAALPEHIAPRGTAPRSRRRRPDAVRPLLYHALAEGVLDARQFDRGMLIAHRARRALGLRDPARAASPRPSHHQDGIATTTRA